MRQETILKLHFIALALSIIVAVISCYYAEIEQLIATHPGIEYETPKIMGPIIITAITGMIHCISNMSRRAKAVSVPQPSLMFLLLFIPFTLVDPPVFRGIGFLLCCFPGFAIFSRQTTLPGLLPLILYYFLFSLQFLFWEEGETLNFDNYFYSLPLICAALAPLYCGCMPLAGYLFPHHRRLKSFWLPARLPRLDLVSGQGQGYGVQQV